MAELVAPSSKRETLGEVAPGAWQLLLGVGVVALGLTVVVEFLFGQGMVGLAHRYLAGFAFFLTITLGSLFFVLVQHLTKAGWSASVRRIAEILSLGVIPLAVLFLPVLATVVSGSHVLYEWNDHELVKSDGLLAGKSGYLNSGFFALRAVIYFAVWLMLVRLFVGTSVRQDEVANPQLTTRMEVWSAPGTLAFALTASFAAIDWLMSLAPHWFSTIFGVYVFAGGLVGSFASITLFVLWLQRRGCLKDVINVEHRHDLGKLLFAFNCFWAYIAFSQYFLIWYANIPEETFWYKDRLTVGWKAVSVALAILHFVIPFVFFMSRHVKRNLTLLLVWSAWLLFAHWLDTYWLVMPQLTVHLKTDGPTFNLADLTCLIGLGGVWLGTIWFLAKDYSLLAVSDPRLPEALAFKNL